MLYSINFLRFVAAACVVLQHASTAFAVHIFSSNIPAVGVDIFFVISGFVIGLAGPSSRSVRDFLLKRLIRIYPIYWIATALDVCLGFYFWHDLPPGRALLFSSALYPDPSASFWHPIYFPGWTLTFELMFYGVFALALALSRRPLAICIPFLLLLAFADLHILGPAGFSSLIVLEFAYGVALAQWHERVDRRPLAIGLVVASASLLLLLCFYRMDERDGWRCLAWGVPAALLVIAARCLERHAWVRSRLATFLGNASYSIYLAHITCQTAFSETLKRQGWQIMDHRLAAFLGLVLVSLAGGCALHAWVERPLLARLKPVSWPRASARPLAS